MTTLREDLDDLVATWEHAGATQPDPHASVNLMHASDLHRVIAKHFPVDDLEIARHATTEPGTTLCETDEEPQILPPIGHPGPLPKIEGA